MSIPSSQKVANIPGLKQDLIVETGEVYEPGPGELLVKIEATALNPVDGKIRALGFFVDSYPFILGSDLTGVVVTVGEGVTDFVVGGKNVRLFPTDSLLQRLSNL